MTETKDLTHHKSKSAPSKDGGNYEELASQEPDKPK